MAKEKIENLSTEKLKKNLFYGNIVSLILGVAAITAIVFYFIDRENSNYELLVVGAGLGAGLSTHTGITVNKLKKEIKNREDK